MKNAAENRPTHIVRGNVLDALGFSAPEPSALKIKAELLFEILQQVKVKGYTQAQLADVLDEYQPSVSNLLRDRISQVSIEKLLRYADRLQLQTSIAVRPTDGRSRRASIRGKQNSTPRCAKARNRMVGMCILFQLSNHAASIKNRGSLFAF